MARLIILTGLCWLLLQAYAFAQTWPSLRIQIDSLLSQKKIVEAEELVTAAGDLIDHSSPHEKFSYYTFAADFFKSQGYFNQQLRFLTLASESAARIFPGDPQAQFKVDKAMILDLRRFVGRYPSAAHYTYAINWFDANIGRFLARYGRERIEMLWIYSVFASLLSDFGDLERALEIAGEIQSAIDRLPAHTKEDRLDAIVHRIGLIHYTAGNLDQTLLSYRKALDLYVAEQGAGQPGEATIHSMLGEVYNEMGDGQKGLESGRKALAILEQNGVDRGLSYYYNAIGVSCSLLNDLGQAEAYFRKACEDSTFVYSWRGLANIFLKQQRFGEAHAALDQAYRIFHYTRPLGFDSLADLSLLPNVLEKRRDIFQAQYVLTGDTGYLSRSEEVSYEICQLYLRIIGTFRGEHNQQKSYTFAIASNQTAIDICYAIYETTRDARYADRLFYYAEINKSLLLLESLLKKKNLQIDQIPDALELREADLKTAITRLEKDQFEKGISQRLFDLREQYYIVQDSVRQYCRDYYKYDYSIDVIGVSDVQNLLDGQSTFIAYALTASHLYILLINRDTYQILRTPFDSTLTSLLVDLTRHISSIDESAYYASIDTIATLSHEAWKRLIQPIRELLKSRLIVVTNGILDYLPFDLLLSTPVAVPERFHLYPYLIRDHSISYNYSASLWRENLERAKQIAPHPLLAFAPFCERISESASAEGNHKRQSFDPLPFSGEEAERIAAIMGGEVRFGSAADKPSVLTLMGQYRILHFATHGKANDRKGQFSYLAFRDPVDSAATALLYVSEIYNVSLLAELVVLSACETGIGEVQTGEGLISIARAFTYSGAKSVLTTLWPIHDQTTRDLMVAFYEFLQQGLPKDEALRQAKLRYLAEHKSIRAHPFYWAALKFIGNGNPL